MRTHRHTKTDSLSRGLISLGGISRFGRTVAVRAVHADGAVADLLTERRPQLQRRAQLHAEDVGQVLGTEQRQCAAVNAVILERL